MQSGVRAPRNPDDAGRARAVRFPRFWIICLIFLLWAVAIGLRLFQLQIVSYKEYKERAGQQQQRNAEVSPRRGDLMDRNHELLATTVLVDSVYAVPSYIADKPTAAHQLAQIVHVDAEDASTSEEQIAARLGSGRSAVRIARAVGEDLAAQVMKLGIKGVYLQKEFQRSYPNNMVAAQVLGYVGYDDAGLSGLELRLENLLHGQPGHENKALDARHHVIGSKINDPVPGQTLSLTIDENIQFRAERALDHAMERTRSATGTVVVQDVRTGQILALAVRPSFNPNRFRYASPELLRNHAVSDVYEPGSTFKLVTYAAALEQRVATPDDKIDCQGGAIKMPGGRIIHDDKGDHFGVITVHEALEHSSDVAAVKLAMRVGEKRFYEFIRDFGFGARTGIELPGETRGLLQPISRWSVSSIGSISMGQEVAVTPVQLVSMVSAIANGGVYMPPRVLMPGQVERLPNGVMQRVSLQQPPPSPVKLNGELPNPLPAGAHRVISTMTAAQMRKMMEGVVLYGTGRSAQLNGYSSGGKTGTAQKIDPQTHRYSSVLHVGSFAGFAPVNNPVIAVAVIMDSPRSGDYYGAQVAAPVFSEVAQQVLEYLGVPHDIPVRAAKAEAKTPVRAMREDESERSGDINALYAAANDLPTDDPMRNLPAASAPAPAPHATASASAPAAIAPQGPTQSRPQSASTAVMAIDRSKRLQVPALVGLPLRKVIERSAQAGLEVEIKGNGAVRQQAPAAGTLVPPGTRIVVVCGK